MSKEMVWKGEKGFQRWGCRDCGGIVPNPRFLQSFDNYVKEAHGAFRAHECTKCPQKPSRGDLSRGAARIAREAIKDK